MVEVIGNGAHAEANNDYSTSLGLIILASSKNEVNKRLKLFKDILQVERGRMRSSINAKIYLRWVLPYFQVACRCLVSNNAKV
jgi:hypothetical protein